MDVFGKVCKWNEVNHLFTAFVALLLTTQADEVESLVLLSLSKGRGLCTLLLTYVELLAASLAEYVDDNAVRHLVALEKRERSTIP